MHDPSGQPDSGTQTGLASQGLLVNLIGIIEGNPTGYGVHTRGFLRALERARTPDLHCLFTEFRKPGEIERNVESCRAFTGRVVNIWLQVGPGDAVLARFPGEKIAYTMFETDVLPDGWVAGLARADGVFTPSAWGREMMIDNGVEARRIHVVPGGVERAWFTPWGPKLRQLESPAFKFLMIGAYQTRKGYAELFTAFRQAFGDRRDVELVVKAEAFATPSAREKHRAAILADAPPQVRVVEGRLGDAAVAALYRSCDCFVFPSRGEGGGLPLFEAMACGLPVIATRCSGHSQLLDPFAGRFLEVSTLRKPVTAPDFLNWYRWKHGAGCWHEPDVDSLAAAMQRVAEGGLPWDPVATALEVRQRFSWDASVDAALRALLRPGVLQP
ncbi:MAG: glycosyltransferase [Burkholderiaceae bacterium]|nr:glycosyltransferase [Burkholderiaceae bacterium]